MIECQICKRLLGTLVGKHLKSHGLSSQEYQDKYPGHPVSAMKPWTDDLRAKQKAARTGRRHSDATRAKIGAGNRGKVMDPEAVARQKVSYRKFLEENNGSPQKGCKRSDEFKAKMSEIARNRSPEAAKSKVDAMLAVRRGQKMTDEQKEIYSEARLKYIEENPDKLIPKLFNTKPEQEFEQILKDKGVEYYKNKRIGNRLYDFVVANCVVELDGPYHRDPLMHGNKGMTLEERQALLQISKDRDAYKTQLAQSNGYRLFRVDVTNHLPTDWHSILQAQGWDIF